MAECKDRYGMRTLYDQLCYLRSAQAHSVHSPGFGANPEPLASLHPTSENPFDRLTPKPRHKMSSFRRKDPSKQSNLKSYAGTRFSPASSSIANTSTGITSLDDILGGGLPLSCTLVVAAPDLHSSYGDLVQRYFIAEGLACGHRMCIIDDFAKDFMQDVMWVPRSSSAPSAETDGSASSSVKEGDGMTGGDLKEDEELSQEDRKVKIAWRYENMKTFQTTVLASSSYVNIAFYSH